MMSKKKSPDSLRLRSGTAEFLTFAYQTGGDGVEVRMEDNKNREGQTPLEISGCRAAECSPSLCWYRRAPLELWKSQWQDASVTFFQPIQITPINFDYVGELASDLS
jgi:hypothetical protein